MVLVVQVYNKKNKMKLDFNDLLIVPKEITDINTRSIINPCYDNVLPLITAPMDTVISNENMHIFSKNKILPCLPRGIKSDIGFRSYSIQQMKNLYDTSQLSNGYYLIDVANGHMNAVLELTKKIKKQYPVLKLMVGNVANPETYRLLSEAGADYVRVGIGNGGGCLTTQNTGVGYPMASLIKECYDISATLDNPAYIVADGGMQTYSDIIKALALGADYVMLGSILNKSLESAGDNYLWKKIKVSQKMAEKAYKLGIPVYKMFRGMSTKEVQKKWGAKVIKTSEGVVRYRKVEYTLSQWSENFEHYLRSAMSYTGSHKLSEFIGKANLIQITNNSYKRFNK
jgi:IMP dehydrogenase/GMP reductase